MKIIHGMSEVAGQGIYSVIGLRNNGVESNMAVWSRNPSNYPVDIDLKIDKKQKKKFPIYAIKMLYFAAKALRRYDIMHSHFGYTLIPFNMDAPWFPLLNKKLFVEFHGSDLRFVFNDIQYEHYKYEPSNDADRNKLRKRRLKLLKYASGIILHDEELIPHLPKVNVPIYIVPLRVDLKKFKYSISEKKSSKPIIVHAPSRRSKKGTEGILESLKNVVNEYELILVEGKSQEEAVEIYRKADIIIDQISVGTYGVFAIEAMALGKPVITYISDDIKKTFPEELPIVSADFDTLPQVIDELLINDEKRIQIGKAGREYAERYHDNNKVAKYLAKIYDGTITDNNLFNVL